MTRRSLIAGLIAGIASVFVGKTADAERVDGVEWEWRGGDVYDDVFHQVESNTATTTSHHRGRWRLNKPDHEPEMIWLAASAWYPSADEGSDHAD